MKILLVESNIRIKEVVKDYTMKEAAVNVVKLITIPIDKKRLEREVLEVSPNLIILNLDNYKSPLEHLDNYMSKDIFKYTSFILTSTDERNFEKIKTKVKCLKKSSYAAQNPIELEELRNVLRDKYSIFQQIKNRVKKLEKQKQKEEIDRSTKKTIGVISKMGQKDFQDKYCRETDTEELDKILPMRSAVIRKKVITIGSSIGGVEVLSKIISMLPKDKKIAPIVITQHISRNFTTNLVKRLDNSNPDIKVQVGEDGEELKENNIYVAPSDKHMGIEKEGMKVVIKIYKEEEMVSKHIPSINVLFRSVNNTVGSSALAIILTGMGKDGVKGMGELYRSGAKTLAQEKKTCTIQGIAGECIVRGFISEEVSIQQIINNIINY